ncbi:hypothetical protein [Hymenobacter weizhouensis]|uniref:hypothetical protein n=1 Tax=Hymenobacter sp. YIM 151500-1 TaxID=2987689 RepID=UPI00222745A0|nr:hypothetical protein [Hymenobacter sp. YIM 151500-1]UYZ64300.1 hypothetical protein OIS53_05480 [Hymenobacter sp. YIM 151500-1]
MNIYKYNWQGKMSIKSPSKILLAMRHLTTILLCCLFYTPGRAQHHKPDRLLQFFQANFDSTIIYHAWSSWYPHPNYYIVAKQGSQSYYFTYKSPYRESKGAHIPGGLIRKFSSEETAFQHAKPDTNRYFLPFPIARQQSAVSWQQINSSAIWQAQEIINPKNTCMIDDASRDTFYLITRKNSRAISYYAAEECEQEDPTNLQRRRVIQTKRAILAVFNGK